MNIKSNTFTHNSPFKNYSIFIALALILGLSGCAELKNLGQETSSSTPPPRPEQMAPTIVKKEYVPDGYLEIIPALPKKGYHLKKLGKGVYFFSNGYYNNLFIVTPEGVIITDPMKGWGPHLKKAIREVTTQPIKFMIYSHSHLNHIGDAHLFKEDVQIVAHNDTAHMLRRHNDPNRPIPQIGFSKNYTLTLGGMKINLIYPGGGHGHGNIMIHIPESKVLMFVDVVTPKAVPSKSFATADIMGQVHGIQKALKLDFDIYVAGHYHRPGKKQEMVEILNYYYASRNANIAALSKIKFKDVVSKSKSKDIIRRMGEYRDAVAEECYRILKPQWKRRLMGFEAFARSHCDTWTSYHKTEKSPAVKK
jgi:glyoxylase-like metal-dependent hydrolase (beta-lactamase superfamily II)